MVKRKSRQKRSGRGKKIQNKPIGNLQRKKSNSRPRLTLGPSRGSPTANAVSDGAASTAARDDGNNHPNTESGSSAKGPVQGMIFGWVPNADLRNRHLGLAEIAKTELKVKVEDLAPGEMVMFINTSWTQFVLYCANHILIHHKRPDGKHLNPKALMLVPQFMEGQRINYAAALKKVIAGEFKQRYPRLAKEQQQ